MPTPPVAAPPALLPPMLLSDVAVLPLPWLLLLLLPPLTPSSSVRLYGEDKHSGRKAAKTLQLQRCASLLG